MTASKGCHSPPANYLRLGFLLGEIGYFLWWLAGNLPKRKLIMNNSQNQKETEAVTILSSQFLISAFIEERLRIVNHIYEGWTNNIPVLFNSPFLHYIGQQLNRAVIIDLFALLGTYNERSNSNSLHAHRIFYEDVYISESIEFIKVCFDEKTEDIQKITMLRHNELAHYNFKLNNSISLTLSNLSLTNEMFELSKTIILKYGSSFKNERMNAGFDYTPSCSQIDDLETIVQYMQKTDY